MSFEKRSENYNLNERSSLGTKDVIVRMRLPVNCSIIGVK